METFNTVLGIDPGMTRMGFGVVEARGAKLICLACGTIKTSPEWASADRLMHLFEELTRLSQELKPDHMAIERVFLNVNKQSAVGSMQASGVALLAAARSKTPVHEYSPAQVKQSVVGTGTATKEQVQFMVGRLLEGAPAPDTADAADALAVAITHLNHRSILRIAEMTG